MFTRFKTRQLIELLERQRDQMIAAYYANSAYDESNDGVKLRLERVEATESRIKDMIGKLRRGEPLDMPSGVERADQEAWENDPLFRRVRKGPQQVQMPNAGRADELMAAGRALGVAT